ncbi:MAG: phenol 2-monooxygenase [Halieaceae bacterium]|jgi:phenol 2-monooxygenase
MQYHLNGFKPGNLQVAESVREQTINIPITDLPEKVDVLIVGCGPAGLTLARQLAEFPSIKTCIVEAKAGPMLFGQADGISCRTIEIMEAFNVSEIIVKEAYWLNQNAFWEPDKQRPENIVRARKVADARMGLSEFPHVVLNQSRLHDLLLNGMNNSPAQIKPDYSRRLIELDIDPNTSQDLQAHPVTATFERNDAANEGLVETVLARYVVGCDGARSTVRKMLDIPLRGDAANKSWGVMDALLITDFPDIRVKSFIQSGGGGSVIIVPREGGYLVRLYIELELLDKDQRVASLDISLEHLIAAAKKIFHPYEFDVKEVPWWSVYEIGQRVADKFDNTPVDSDGSIHPRAFIAGDACHTHSPKAGQGLNVAIHDAFNLGWKLASVLLGRCQDNVLNTYSEERRKIAQDLISLDKALSTLVSTQPTAKKSLEQEGGNIDEIQKYIAKQSVFIAGTGVQYGSSILCADSDHQQLAEGFEIGKRFHSAKAIRLCDGRLAHIGHLIKADGRWRIFIFGDSENPLNPAGDTNNLIHFLAESPDSPVRQYTPAGSDIDSVIDVYSVFQQQSLSIETMPDFLWPAKGKYGLRDYEKVFIADAGNDLFDSRGINRSSGCMVVVRPDQHIAHILPLTARKGLTMFFDKFLI